VNSEQIKRSSHNSNLASCLILSLETAEESLFAQSQLCCHVVFIDINITLP